MPDILDSFEERTKQHRNFKILILPNTGYGAVLAHDLDNGETARKAVSQDDDVLGDLKMRRDVFGWWPWLRHKVFVNALSVTQVEEATNEARKPDHSRPRDPYFERIQSARHVAKIARPALVIDKTRLNANINQV